MPASHAELGFCDCISKAGFNKGVRQACAGFCSCNMGRQSRAPHHVQPMQPRETEVRKCLLPHLQSESTTPESIWITPSRSWLPTRSTFLPRKEQQLRTKTMKRWSPRQTQTLGSRGPTCWSIRSCTLTNSLKARCGEHLTLACNTGLLGRPNKTSTASGQPR